jgi:predicted  nucleic acid-binding Zn-ribbon protein
MENGKLIEHRLTTLEVKLEEIKSSVERIEDKLDGLSEMRDDMDNRIIKNSTQIKMMFWLFSAAIIGSGLLKFLS